MQKIQGEQNIHMLNKDKINNSASLSLSGARAERKNQAYRSLCTLITESLVSL